MRGNPDHDDDDGDNHAKKQKPNKKPAAALLDTPNALPAAPIAAEQALEEEIRSTASTSRKKPKTELDAALKALGNHLAVSSKVKLEVAIVRKKLHQAPY